VDRQVPIAHKAPGYAIVNISLKPVGGIPGDASAEQMDLIADLAERYSFDECRVTHAQNLVLPHVRKQEAARRVAALVAAGLADANLDRSTDIIACPGLDYCSLANARSIPWRRRSPSASPTPQAEDLGELKIKISGCINACGHHHAGHIGILGVDRKGTENYQLLLGGSGDEDTRWPRSPAPASTRTASSTRSRRRPTSISHKRSRASASSIPTAASAWNRSRRRSMADAIGSGADDVQFRFPRRSAGGRASGDARRSSTSPTPLGRIEAGDDVRTLLGHLDRWRLVEVDFPKFGDGRGYSSARILREAGYTGEMRATGRRAGRPDRLHAPLRL
jgi:hypothetical protein